MTADTLAGRSVRTVPLPSGTLTLTAEPGPWTPDDLLTCAVRRNPRRGFLFVSRVLGKHIPIDPRVAVRTWNDFAAQLGALDLTAPHVIGLAETATALGEGVARAYRATCGPATFQHTTRYVTDAPTLLRFDEPHSHAPAHVLYDPGEPARRAGELVLIDDEISTGTTLVNLARAWIARHPHVTRVVLVSLTDWCPRRAEVEREIGVPTTFVSLLRGTYAFTPDPAWTPPELPAVIGSGADRSRVLAPLSARLGHVADADLGAVDTPAITRDLARGGRVLVLGTGEYQYPPAQLALALQARGHDVRWSATTRSPVLPGHAMTRVLTFTDNVGDGIANYVYNVDAGEYATILVAHEGACRPDAALMAQLGPHAHAVALT